MPLGAAEGRSRQLATLEVMAHELLTAPEIGDLLGRAKQQATALDDWQQRQPARNAPPLHPREGSAVRSRRSQLARLLGLRGGVARARADSDFASLLPLLAEVLDRQREVGQAKGDVLGLSAYDALLDSHEPGMRAATIDPLFAELRAGLPGLIQAALAHQAGHGPVCRWTGRSRTTRSAPWASG